MIKLNTTHLTHALLILLAGLTLAACDAVPTEATIATTGNDPVADYAGNQCATSEACAFKIYFWNEMGGNSCENCHNSAAKKPQYPFFLDQNDVNTAYNQALTVVDLTDPSLSKIVSKIAGGHNCGDAPACAALATIVQGYITNWATGGGSGGGGSSNDIVLKAPTIKDAGASKSLPADSTSFAATVWPLLTANCSGCHKESATVPQAPFFAESDVAKAYDAIKTSQKINLDDPASSRLVVRLRQEFHNCWDPNSTGSTDCAASAQKMEDAITAFANTVSLSQVDSSWITSKALKIAEDGIVASGGKRDDSSTIALYQFKSGTGNTVYDTSGVNPALNLTLAGTEGIDYKWVGGWGVEFISDKGKAQGSTTSSRKLRDRIVATGEYSIEAWVVPANINQGTAGDPERIITYSGGDDRRNFTLGQAEYRYEAMNRSANSDANGGPSLITDDTDADLKATQQHVVLTYDPINGRKIYVNGVDVSTVGNDAGSTDTTAPGSLTNWDDSFALLLGGETSKNYPWAGKLRLVAIHNRAMTQAQIQQNFDAGVGEKFFLLFSVSDQLGGDCLVAGERQCFVYFTVSQFDSYSYLFTKPTFVSLNPAFTPSNTVIKGMRIGLNGKEPAVGQAYRNLNTTINTTDYASNGQALSDIGTVIALEKAPVDDEFFLTFEQLGGNTNVRVEACNTATPCTSATPADGERVPDVGLRTFEEIYASMAAMTGVDPYLPQFSAVADTYYKVNATTGVVTGIKQQMPTVENLDGFLSAHQMAIAQLAIQFCDALVEDGTLRGNFFGSFGFDQNLATAFGSGDSAQKNQIVDALYDKMAGYPTTPGGSTTLSNMPSRTDLKTELIGPAATNPNNLFDRLYNTCAADSACTQDATRTRAVTKAMCTAVLGSAAMLIQ